MHLWTLIWALQVTISILLAVSKSTVDAEDCVGYRTENNSEIFSPMHPKEYTHNIDCTWRIKAPEGHIIRLTFSSFNLEKCDNCRCDYVLVEETEGDSIGRFCDSVTPPVITSLGNTLIVKFHSDHSKAAGGFKARYEFLPKSNESCGGDLTETNSYISSPMFPQPYPPNANCKWIIRAPLKYIIRLTFSNFSLLDSESCQDDYVLVEERDVKRFCGLLKPPVITSQNNVLMVEFHSNRILDGLGFRAKYQFLPNPKGCGVSHRRQNNSHISSPMYPRRYPKDVDCTWQITAPVGHIIRLTFMNFSLEVSASCGDAYVLVEGAEREAIRVFCGTVLPPFVNSENNTLKVNFHSGTGIGGDGFRAKFQFLPNPRICGGNRTQNNSEISSPLYPQPYPHNADCTWWIKAPEDHRIRLTFSNFNLEEDSEQCQFDYVLVQDIEGDTIGMFCGTEIPAVITSLNNSVIVKFHSDHSEAGDGFKARYEFLPESNGNSTFSGEANRTVEHGTTNANALHGTSEATENLPLETEASTVTEVPHETSNDNEVSTAAQSAIEMPYKSELPHQTYALTETVPHKTETPIETIVPHVTETSIETILPQVTETPCVCDERYGTDTSILSAPSHATEYGYLEHEALSATENRTSEANKTVEIILGILLCLSTLMNAVGFYIYKRRSRRKETDMSLKRSVYAQRTEENEYAASPKECATSLI